MTGKSNREWTLIFKSRDRGGAENRGVFWKEKWDADFQDEQDQQDFFDPFNQRSSALICVLFF